MNQGKTNYEEDDAKKGEAKLGYHEKGKKRAVAQIMRIYVMTN